jgi:hypothetical protein
MTSSASGYVHRGSPGPLRHCQSRREKGVIDSLMGKRHTIARMGDADRAVEPGCNYDDKAGARRPEVAALVAKLRDGVVRLQALPLEGVPPAFGERPLP